MCDSLPAGAGGGVFTAREKGEGRWRGVAGRVFLGICRARRPFRRSVSMFLSSSRSLRFSVINSSTTTVRLATNALAALYANAATEAACVYTPILLIGPAVILLCNNITRY